MQHSFSIPEQLPVRGGSVNVPTLIEEADVAQFLHDTFCS